MFGSVDGHVRARVQVRDLASLVESDDVIATENLTTLFVVVPKSSKADWSGGYERLSDYVVRPLA